MNSIRFVSEHFESLKNYLFSFPGKEAAAFALAGAFTNDSGTHFAVREVMLPSATDYDAQTAYHLQVSPIFFNRVIDKAENENLAVVICHSHPWANKRLKYSPSDDFGEDNSVKTLMECLNGKPVASLLFGMTNIIGRVRHSRSLSPVQLGQLRLVDHHLRFLNLTSVTGKTRKAIPPLFSRQVLTFGSQVQQILENLKIGIIGLGGTGSCVAEQLARLGIQDFLLVDKDCFEPSNLSRLYGSDSDDLTNKSLWKVSIAERNIKRTFPSAKVECIFGDVISQRTLSRLKNCDVIFSCTDSHSSRSVVNEMAYQYFIPVIDMGVGLDAPNSQLRGGTIRVSLISPTMPCFFCQDIIRSDTISVELMPEKDRVLREREGYVRGVQSSHAPSLVSFTTTAAGYGVDLFIDILCSYIKNPASNYVLDIQTFSSRRMLGVPKTDCVCAKRLGRGDYMSLSAP
jgi:tRNA A37 threonylcarbamoyladenosine dehydratase